MIKESKLRKILKVAENFPLSQTEREMAIAIIQESSLSEVKRCLNDDSVNKEFHKELSDFYCQKLKEAVDKLSKSSLGGLLEKYHQRKEDLDVLFIAICKKIKEEKERENILLLTSLAQKYFIPGISEKLIQAIKSFYN